MTAIANRRRSLALSGAILLVLVISTLVQAAPGDLDPTFDGDGLVTTDIASSNDRAYGMAIQPDGKIVTTGSAFFFGGGGERDVALTRHNPNGSLDTSFDADGKVTTDFSAGSSDIGRDVAIQTDGKIVIAGGALGDFALARYNADGSLDTSFDGDGKLMTDFGGTGDAHAVAVQSDGKIVAAGGGPGDFALVRYNADGSLDTTFDGDGKATTDFGGTSDTARAMAIQSDGKILALGDGQGNFALARYNADGSLDTTFDTDGKVMTDFGEYEEGHGVALQADGKIVVVGRVDVLGVLDFGLARYNADGTLDTTFDGDGKVTTDFGSGNDRAFGVVIQIDGKIVVAGCAGVMCEDDNDHVGLARYNPNGSLDATFGGGDGKVTTDFSASTNWAHAVALQKDGRIVVAGFAGWIPGDFALARYKVCRPTSRRSSIPC